MRPQKMSEAEIILGLAALPGWSLREGRLHRVFACKNFQEAFGRMASVALAAEAMNHHPDWSNSWNKVTIELITHSAGGLTALDFELARKIQTIFDG